MRETPKTDDPPPLRRSGGGTYGQQDFSQAAQHSRFQTEKAGTVTKRMPKRKPGEGESSR